ncbi:MAG: hypothetical protein ACTSVL_02330 [Promethearchaeota archaeon]
MKSKINLLKYIIRRVFTTVSIIVSVMFLTLVITFNMTEKYFRCGIGGEYGLDKPIIIQFYSYLTIAIGLFWTWFIFAIIGGYSVFVVFKGIRLGFEKKKIHIRKNLQKVATKRGLTVK